MKLVCGVKTASDCKCTLEIASNWGNLDTVTRSVKPTVNSVLLLVSYVVRGKNALSQTKGHGIYSLSVVTKEVK
jgi:hypothetical protein